MSARTEPPTEKERQLLHRRARLLGLEKQLPPALDAHSWAVWVLAGTGQFLFPLDGVHSATRLGTLTPVPFAPSFVRGLTHEKGRLLPVMELSALLLAGVTANAGYLITLAAGEQRCSFAVAEVRGFVRMDPAGLHPPPISLPSELRGVVRATDPEGRGVIDVLELFRIAGLQVLAKSNEAPEGT